MTKKRYRIVALLMAFLMIFGSINVSGPQSKAATNYVTAQRTTDVTTIHPGDEVSVTLNITGTPPVNVVKPNDVVLILDKSGSMQNDNRFNAMINSAKEFIDLVDFSSHQVGIVDFSSSNNVNSYPLSTNATDLKNNIDQIQCGGETYTDVAINKAMDVLAQGRPDAQPVIILLTDGQATQKTLALEAATKAKEAGIVFYTIALLGPSENPDTSAPNALMKDMATTSNHHHFVLGSVGLMDIYRAIVKEIGIASAYQVNITETIGPEFELVPDSYSNNIPAPTVSGNTLVWNMQELKADTLTLQYKVKLKDGIGAGTYNLAPNTKITYKDFAGANRIYSIPNTNIIVKNRAPVVTSITPDSGPIAGGDVVTIKGDNFLPGAKVRFNLTFATNVQVVDSNTITATVPIGTQGKVPVLIVNPDSQTGTGEYQYLADPIITSIAPNNGPFDGGNNVQIKGNYFMIGATIYFGDKIAKINTLTSTYINVAVPPADQAGPTSIKIVNPDGTELTADNAYTYNEKIVEKLSITSITPSSGILTGGNKVTIEGTKILSGAKVYFGDVEGTVAASTSTTTKIVTVPASTTTGVVNVKIVNTDGESAELPSAYEYLPVPAPTITSISATEGQLVGGEIIYIVGTNFQSGLTVQIGNNQATLLNYYDATKIRVKVPAGVSDGLVDVTVINPDGQQGSLPSGYNYLPAPEVQGPSITTLTPAEGLVTGGDIIFIEGTNFISGLTVSIGNTPATLLNYYGATKIRVKVPAGVSEGSVDVTVTNPDGKQATLTGGYNYLPLPEEESPTITLLSATEGELTGREIIFIEGTNFKSGLTVNFGANKATLLNYYDATKIRVQVPAGTTAGLVNVTITNPSGKQALLTDGYKYNEYIPQITSISVTSGIMNTDPIAYITGKNLAQGLTVTIGGQPAQILNYYDSTKIRVVVPTSTSVGSVDIVVQNPDGATATLTNGYEYLPIPAKPVATISYLTTTSSTTAPPITSAIAKQIVFVHGTNMVISGTDRSIIRIVDSAGTVYNVAPLNYYSDLKLRFQIPATIAKGDAQIYIVSGAEVSAPYTITIQ